MILSQQLQQLAIKLECAEQEIQIMKLEKIEYEKEVNLLYQIYSSHSKTSNIYTD